MSIYDQSQPEKLIGSILSGLGLGGTDLTGRKKSAPEKQVVAWIVGRRTTASMEWVAEGLAMGHRTSVTAAVKKVSTENSAEYKKIKKKLNEILVSENPFAPFAVKPSRH